ncbi:RsmB/NOP family class I SAM-dependent RNA methyltransferase [Candidatus Woesearchaeota archaeon]|nr:RsmB/NOP family class I SAM-dependent RNA methyltransferase [Candidatus Woesearchaeota archaeon]
MNLKERHEKLGGKFVQIDLPTTIRINPLKLDEKKIIERLKQRKIQLKKVSYLDYGYIAEANFSVGSTQEYLQGYYYLQEGASQIPVQVLDPKPGELVIDMCASPGGKTTQIAQLMKNKGQIIALDIGKRTEKLCQNIERMGAENIIVYKRDARFFDLRGKVDKILLDAPCSGNFVIEKDWYKKRTINDIKTCARTQKELLAAGIDNLKDGGILIYSTCSLEPEENEMIIDWALSEFEISLEKINLDIGDAGLVEVDGQKLNPEVKKCKRFWPHKTGTQGFFIAKFRKD